MNHIPAPIIVRLGIIEDPPEGIKLIGECPPKLIPPLTDSTLTFIRACAPDSVNPPKLIKDRILLYPPNPASEYPPEVVWVLDLI